MRRGKKRDGLGLKVGGERFGEFRLVDEEIVAAVGKRYRRAERGPQNAAVDLVRDQIDVALRLGPRPTGDLVIARLSNVAMRLVASPDVARRLGKPAQPDKFTALPCLIAANQPRARWHFRREAMQAVIEVRGTISTSNTLALRQFARDGLGYAVLPDRLVDGDIAAGRLVDVMPDWQMTPGDFEAGIWIAYPSRRFLPSKTRAFLDFLTSRAPDRRPSPSR